MLGSTCVPLRSLGYLQTHESELLGNSCAGNGRWRRFAGLGEMRRRGQQQEGKRRGNKRTLGHAPTQMLLASARLKP